jgi:ATP-dependent helicase HrpB
LARALRPHAASFFRNNTNAEQWLSRVDLLKRSLPELDWPVLSDPTFAEILDAVCEGKSRLEEAERADLVPYLQSRLTPAQIRELQESAPQMLSLPTGRTVRLEYQPSRPPILSVRLQELFGWTETPRIARGRVPVLLNLLGPNNRTVQITDDLKSFWTNTYHQIRKDLRRRYPKHAWPEDPFQAQLGKPPRRPP